MQRTAQQIIVRALKANGALGAGDTLTADEGADALLTLNGMLDLWRAERLTIPLATRHVYSLVVADETYTIGPSGNFNQTQNPVWLERASVISNTNPTQPLELPLEVVRTMARWQAIGVKNIQSALPAAVLFERRAPLSNLTFWPVPTQSSLQTALYTADAELESFALLSTAVDLLEGYDDAITYQLALRLALDYGRTPVDPDLKQLAQDTFGIIQRSNLEPMELLVDTMLMRASGSGGRGGTYDWRTDR
jgi:hypothetical protein